MRLSNAIFLSVSLVSLEAFSPAAVAQDKPAASAPAVAKPAKTKNASDADSLGLGSHDSNAPIDITADNFDYDLNTKIGTYTGNVVVIQGEMRMRSDKMKVNVTQGKPTHIESIGHVVVTAPNGTATGDNGVYDLGPHTITMTGNVVLTKQKDVMHGTKLVMDMNTNVAHMYAQGMPGGRVHGLFVPKDNSSDTSGSKKTGKHDKTATAPAPAPADTPAK